ncbi:MAG: chromosome segregation protein SMC [Pseudomonadota bacterium]
MKIKKLEVVGFKSFLEKTTFHFDVPVTAIVGPNGCGKSNVVDAVKWVTGELSFKELRGRSMEDLIFAGSESRPPIGMMEVTLTLDNQDGSGPPQYSQYSDVAVLRRIFRDGTSEFYINKIPCRLRDIIDLFLDTGIGQSSYSIIEQGKVGAIVSGRPEDRRLVIEEAAGITKYKHRKKAAQRKMEYTRQNLLRVSDVLVELKRQIGSLERQARQAEKFRKARDEARVLDIALSAREYLEIDHRQKSLATDEGTLTEQWSAEDTEFIAREARHEKVRLELLESEEGLEEAQNLLFSCATAVTSLESKIESLHRETQQLRASAESERERIVTLTERRGSFASEIDRIISQLTVLETERAMLAGTLAETSLRHDECRQGEASAAAELETKKGRLLEIVAKEGELRNQLANCQQRIREIDQTIETRRGEIHKMRDRLSELERTYEHGKASLGASEQLRFGFRQSRESIRSQLSSMVEERETTAEKLGTVLRELEGQRGRLQALEEFTRTYQGYRQGVRAVMERRVTSEPPIGKILGLLGELIRPNRGFERAVQAALSELIECIVVDSTDDALRAIDFLKGEKRGRGAFLPKSIAGTKPRAEGMAGRSGVVGWLTDYLEAEGECREGVLTLLHDVLVVESLPTALLLRSEGLTQRMVTPAGDLVTAEGIVVGGDGSEERGILEVKQEIADLTDSARKNEALKTELEGRTAHLLVQIDACEHELAKIGLDLERQDQESFTKEKDTHRLEETLRNERQNVTTAETELERLLAEKVALQHRTETAAASSSSLEAEKRGLETLLEERAGRLAAARTDLAQQAELLTDFRVREASLAERQASFDGQHRSFLQQDADAAAEQTRLSESISRHEAEAERKTVEAATLDMERKDAIVRHQAQQEIYQAARTEHDERATQIHSFEAELKTAREQREKLTERLNGIHLRVREEILRAEHLVTQLMERHGIRLPEWVTQPGFAPIHEEEVPKARTDLAELRDRMSKIGDVNLAAIEEVAQLKERHDFLAAQKEDLEKSLEALGTAIRKINATTRERFVATFEAVNEKFERLFPRLFGGGRAKLVLLDPENILETGVDIVAQPPGKKLQNMNLLSGGEKALTAIALLFAIFEHKAPPFCVLDEVDAPLDDLNVRRFNKMVAEMSKQIQFILITHNKTTMETAVNLFGVTMEEPGVSRMVSVRVSQVADVAADRPGIEAPAAVSAA